MYWLPKLHKRPYKVRFIANSSSCTTTEITKLLTSFLTAIKAKLIKYCETVYERSGKNMFWPIKNSGEVLSKLKDIGYQAPSLSTYDFSTLYTTLPHNLIKEKLIDLIERTFYKKEGKLYLACNDKKAFSLQQTIIEDAVFCESLIERQRSRINEQQFIVVVIKRAGQKSSRAHAQRKHVPVSELATNNRYRCI